jgi:hypothetical protein
MTKEEEKKAQQIDLAESANVPWISFDRNDIFKEALWKMQQVHNSNVAIIAVNSWKMKELNDKIRLLQNEEKVYEEKNRHLWAENISLEKDMESFKQMITPNV